MMVQVRRQRAMKLNLMAADGSYNRAHLRRNRQMLVNKCGPF
jgi:hypothetical protein